LRFQFSTATKIIFGPGTLAEAASIAAKFGNKALVVVGENQARAQQLLKDLSDQGVTYHLFSITGEPTVEMIQQGGGQASRTGCRIVIAMGGGSVIDGGKAIAAKLTNPGDLYNYLEVVGKGRPLDNAPAPFIAIPTTAGTGAEVTANAVLQSIPHAVKVSLRSPLMLPKAVIVDPLLSCSMPPSLTAATGMDALTQLIEAFVSPMGNPITDVLCRDGLQRAARALLTAYENGDHIDARTDMALAALFSGMALANAKLGAVHGIAGPLGGMAAIPHGFACARLLPLVMKANLSALRRRQPDAEAIGRYNDIAAILTGKRSATAEEGVAWVVTICRKMQIPGFAQFEIKPTIVSDLVPKSRRASSMQGNPIELTVQELADIVVAAC